MADSSARVTVSEVPLKTDENDSFAKADNYPRAASFRNSGSESAWQVITLKPRVDALNHADLVSEIHEALAEGSKKIALDLTQNRFFSLNAIQFCMSVARDLYGDGGSLALIGCAERTKRHFDIYGSLKQIRIVRSMDELVTDGSGSSVNVRLRQISPEAR
jgi:anti-anti-sigma regulatory factor